MTENVILHYPVVLGNTFWHLICSIPFISCSIDSPLTPAFPVSSNANQGARRVTVTSKVNETKSTIGSDRQTHTEEEMQTHIWQVKLSQAFWDSAFWQIKVGGKDKQVKLNGGMLKQVYAITHTHTQAHSDTPMCLLMHLHTCSEGETQQQSRWYTKETKILHKPRW